MSFKNKLRSVGRTGLNAPVLKTGERPNTAFWGFESLTLRQKGGFMKIQIFGSNSEEFDIEVVTENSGEEGKITDVFLKTREQLIEGLKQGKE